jgi:hypothetical protein
VLRVWLRHGVDDHTITAKKALSHKCPELEFSDGTAAAVLEEHPAYKRD